MIQINSNNLIPNSERTHEELSSMGKKGGIASGQARRAKKERVKDLQSVVERCTYGEVIGMLLKNGKK